MCYNKPLFLLSGQQIKVHKIHIGRKGHNKEIVRQTGFYCKLTTQKYAYFFFNITNKLKLQQIICIWCYLAKGIK